MLIKISYPLSSRSPLYPGTSQITYQSIKSMQRGDSADTTLISLPSHAGTHIDAPSHFCPKGKSIREVLGDFVEFTPVYCINIHRDLNKSIRISHFRSQINDCRDAAGLLIRTGMHQYRDTDNHTYCSEHPWIHPEVPSYLRTMCPHLCIFGTDTISISSPKYRSEGQECHKAFLCGDNPILLAEDLKLLDPVLTSATLKMTVHPLLIDDLDGIPIHAFAELSVLQE